MNQAGQFVDMALAIKENAEIAVPGGECARPQVGEITSGPVRWMNESFAALDGAGMKELGLL